ncbi:hypothetical protein GOBAR_AA07941 [Gossypium barbadense]|uniref:DUF659 domain-containing protein n=1 Tax=Gossypium barbadense TaxID=3634 RepID=A0A2P5YAT7_GOSBA|nr:hypothetical protein GOBAR_AA07941 [Gossypium barbadense]
MPQREEVPTKGLEGAPSNDIGTPVPNAEGNIICKLCGKVVKGGITRFKKHIAHKTGNVAPCPNVTGVIRESVIREKEEDEHEEFIDEVSATRQATRESIQSQHEWHRREEFRRSTGGWDNIYEEGRSSHGLAREYHRERTSKSIPTSSPWLYNLIQVSAKVGQSVKLPTPYEVSDVYLESEYQRVRDWVNGLKTHWKELGATLIKGTNFWKSVDVSSVSSRDVEFYYSLLDSVVEEIGENYIVQIVTDNEVAMKAAGKIAMKNQQWVLFMRLLIELNEQFNKIVDISPSTKGLLTIDGILCIPTYIQLHSENVRIETLEGTRSVIERSEPSLDTQVRMVNHVRFKDKHETFGTPQAQRAWKQMNPDVDPLSEWLHEKENPLLDGENAVQRQSQSGDGPDGGGLSPINKDDGYSRDRVTVIASIISATAINSTRSKTWPRLQFKSLVAMELERLRTLQGDCIPIDQLKQAEHNIYIEIRCPSTYVGIPNFSMKLKVQEKPPSLATALSPTPPLVISNCST